jgi:hypothetical protein
MQAELLVRTFKLAPVPTPHADGTSHQLLRSATRQRAVSFRRLANGFFGEGLVSDVLGMMSFKQIK